MPRALSLRAVSISIAVSALFCATAAAENAWTVHSTNLRAGPDREYPVVTRIPGGAPVDVAGCVEGYTWCDVTVGPDRGWVYAANLEYPYEGHRVVLYSHPWAVVPIVPWAVGPYWDSYYVSRPFYHRRSYWVAHPYHPMVVHPSPRGVVVEHGHGHTGHPVAVAPHPVSPSHVAPSHHPVEAHPAPAHAAPPHPAPAHPAHAAPAPHSKPGGHDHGKHGPG
jgi:uncharacterized protein YraI